MEYNLGFAKLGIARREMKEKAIQSNVDILQKFKINGISKKMIKVILNLLFP